MKWVKYDCNGDEQVWYSDDEVEKLEAENAELKAYMDVNEDFKKAWEELKAENARLKSCLQEIKKIAETCTSCGDCGCAINQMSHILDLITKAESEEV